MKNAVHETLALGFPTFTPKLVKNSEALNCQLQQVKTCLLIGCHEAM